MRQILREITPISPGTLYHVKNTPNDNMEFPLHYHNDFEITLTLGVKAQRIVGNLIEEFEGEDLVLVGPNVPHCYKKDPSCKDRPANVTVVQFSCHVQEFKIFSTDVLKPISDLFERAETGVRFTRETTDRLKYDILALPSLDGVEGALMFIRILYSLAVSEGQTQFAGVVKPAVPDVVVSSSNDRVASILKYVKTHYAGKISLEDIGELVHMSPSAVSRFFKAKTHYRFGDFLSDYRVDRVLDMMVRTDKTIAEICFACGFNNISNFNRTFRMRTGCTPSEYREKMKNGEVSTESRLTDRWDKVNGDLMKLLP